MTESRRLPKRPHVALNLHPRGPGRCSPYKIQDVLPSDTRFKLLFFIDYLTEERIRELDALSNEMQDPSCFQHHCYHIW